VIVKSRVAVAVLVAGLVALLAALFVRGHATAAPATADQRSLVAVFPEIGTVYSRYECSRGWRFALGIHVSGPQTTLVRIRTGSVSSDREIQPGRTRWFAYSLSRTQLLAAEASGENGEVYGWMRVIGYPRSGRDCAPYAPPRVTAQTYPRGYYRLSGYQLLRHLIG
jgi:hypothetical protein